jgi:membrane protease YdiL (CAAX protease family)
MRASEPPPGAVDARTQLQFGEAPTADDRPSWPASAGLWSLLIAVVATAILLALIGSFYVAAGYDDPGDAPSFEFVAIAGQSAAFVLAVLTVASRYGRPRARQFGFRGTDGTAVGWALVALFCYFVIAATYNVLVNPPEDDLPQQLGADKNTALAIITGIFVIGVAPPIEEFFFRGFLYQTFRNRIGVWGGAVASGLIFGAIHFKPDFLVPLAMLGMILALLFERTDSLWPCIAVHALNNALAFSVLV